MKRIGTIFSLPILLTLLSSCAVGPDYQEPEWEFDEQFRSARDAEFLYEEVDSKWWEGFRDPMLDSLLNSSEDSNKNVLQAVARVERARALRRNSLSELFPGAQLSGSYEEGEDSGARFPGSSDSAGSGGFKYEVYTAGVDALWELDIFGRLRRELEASDAELIGAEADVADVARIVKAEIANTYFDLRRAQRQLRIAKENVEVQKESLRVAEVKYEFGLRGELDQAQARAQLESTRASIFPLEAEVRVAIHRISVLLGKQPQELSPDLLTPQKLPEFRGPVTIGSPRSLLRNRPDVRVAERRLAAETARIGVAVGELFPKLEIGGSLGVEAPELSDLTEGRGTYRWGPSITWKPFDFGRLRSLIKAQEATSTEALHAYELSVLTALEEVENSLTRYSTEQTRFQRLREAFAASKRAFEISDAQYREGVIDFLSVLTSQANMLRDENEMITSKAQLAKYLVGIYKAFGGGWSEKTATEDAEEVANLERVVPALPRSASAEELLASK